MSSEFDQWSREWCGGILHYEGGEPEAARTAAEAAWDGAIDAVAARIVREIEKAKSPQGVLPAIVSLGRDMEDMKNEPYNVLGP